MSDETRETAKHVRDCLNEAVAHADRYRAKSVRIPYAECMMAAAVANKYVELVDQLAGEAP